MRRDTVTELSVMRSSTRYVTLSTLALFILCTLHAHAQKRCQRQYTTAAFSMIARVEGKSQSVTRLVRSQSAPLTKETLLVTRWSKALITQSTVAVLVALSHCSRYRTLHWPSWIQPRNTTTAQTRCDLLADNNRTMWRAHWRSQDITGFTASFGVTVN